MAYCGVTFLCWLFGGWFGLHHFYLGRDKHGFLWATSCGGFVIGWLREFYKLKIYTDDANKDYPLKKSPSIFSNFNRVIAMFVFGVFYRQIFINSIPEELLPSAAYRLLLVIIPPLGTSLATYMIANIGHIKCSFVYPLIGAYIGEILFGYTHLLWEDQNQLLLLLLPIVLSVRYWRERKKRTQWKFCRRVMVWSGLGLLFCCMWLSFMYYNVEIYVEELDENVKLRVVLSEAFDSPEWKQIKEEITNLIKTLWETGGDYERTWSLLQEGAALTRILNSLETLGFERRVNSISELSEGLLTKRYRELSRQWHPDKHPATEKDHAQEMFIEIQKAYETLKTVVKRRSRKTEL